MNNQKVKQDLYIILIWAKNQLTRCIWAKNQLTISSEWINFMIGTNSWHVDVVTLVVSVGQKSLH
jgi:hypothetical protein